MTILAWCELECAACRKRSPGVQAYDRVLRRPLIQKAEWAGWVFTRQAAFCSEKCKQTTKQ